MNVVPAELKLVIGDDEEFGWIGATALINGIPVASGWHGASVPADDLLTEPSPLLHGLPRRVVLRLCTCGIVGCGSASALITSAGPFVYWHGWEVTLPYGADEDPSPSEPPAIANFAFERGQYEGAVIEAVRLYEQLVEAHSQTSERRGRAR